MPVQPMEFTRMVCVNLIPFLAFVAAMCNLPGRKDAWGTRYQFSLHAYEKKMTTSTHFTGPFMSKVYVLPSVGTTLHDSSPSQHVHCNSHLDIVKDQRHIDKCKMMRSAPMYLGNVTNAWSVLGEQSTFVLTKHMLLIFIVFTIFWCSEFALTDMAYTKVLRHVYVRNFVVFVAVCVFIGELVSDVTSSMSTNVAIGSVSTAFSFVVVCLLIICFEYGGMKGSVFLLYTDAVDVEKAKTKAVVGEINKPHKDHIHRNMYLSYASLLMLPMAVVFILASSHAAVVDVHIQLVFFSFIFYATLDVFQTRTTAVLLCVTDIPPPTEAVAKAQQAGDLYHVTSSAAAGTSPEQGNDGAKQAQHKEKAKASPATAERSTDLWLVQVFVVVAFCLCKCFALLPAMNLLHRQYSENDFQKFALWVQYVVPVGFAIADLVHINYRHLDTDVPKLMVMLVYTSLVFFGIAAAVDR